MPDFNIFPRTAKTLTIELQPPTAIGGWNLRFRCSKHLGGLSGGIVLSKTSASGYGGSGAVSGIQVTDSGKGIFDVTLNSVDTSGLAYGNYAFAVERLDSGSQTMLSQGYLILKPGLGG